MKILVCGGRNFANPIPNIRTPENQKAINQYSFVQAVLNKIVNSVSSNYNPRDNWHPTDVTIISGKARGVDSAAADFATISFCQLEEYPADWNKYPKAAGPIRNQQMLDEGKPNLVVAFPGGRGTADMVRRARKAGVEVKEITYD